MLKSKILKRHVRAKTSWKSVQIPQNLFEDDLFHGVVDVQELSDYEFEIEKDHPHHDKDCNENEIDLEKQIISGNLLSSKGRKRKKKSEETQLLSSSNLRKKRKTDIPEKHSSLSKKQSKQKASKITKGKIILGSDTLNVDGSVDTSANDNVKSIPSECTGLSNAKKKKKQKKKKKNALKQQQSPTEVALSNDEVEANINTSGLDMSTWRSLYVPEELILSLQDQGFSNPTEIQLQALPSAIRDKKDILGAAETGSGKTLAFGIPVLTQILSMKRKEKMESESMNDNERDGSDDMENQNSENLSGLEKSLKPNGPMALILEPTRELAIQVYKHLSRLSKHTKIQLATVVGGMSVEKQHRILKRSPEIVIATPGRLWQLIEEGDTHLSQVDCVYSLVVDEADRMIEKGHYEELTKLLHFINESPRRVKRRQTFIMSATLSTEIGMPHRLKAKIKKKSAEEGKLKTLTEKICVSSKPKIIDLTTKKIVARSLTSLRINCAMDEKDYYLYYFLCEYPGRTLVFVNSKDCLRRLVSLFTLLQCSPLPLHADMHQSQRLKNLDHFAGNSKALLVASDVAARGLDIPNIDHVIHYQVPRTIENYVHRSGRTARASNIGFTVMLVGAEDARNYAKIVQVVEKGKEIPILPTESELMPAVKMRVELAKQIDVTEHRSKKKKTHNNFFQKAAQEMDMILDDDRLLLDLGSAVEQSQEKQEMKAMRNQLSAMLKKPLAPLHMTKYPTKSGQLVSKKVIDLNKL